MPNTRRQWIYAKPMNGASPTPEQFAQRETAGGGERPGKPGGLSLISGRPNGWCGVPSHW
jgi:hypothetical protein